MVISETQKNKYIADVHAEMSKRGLSEDDIKKVISKTGFEDAMRLYPEEQMHYAITDAVNEILLVAAVS